MAIRRQRIRALVEEVLKEAKITKTPVVVDKLALKLGMRVFRQSLEGDMSGFLAKSGEQVVIGVNTDHHENRQRFTIAHEIGHFLLHKPNAIHVDRTFKAFIRLRDEISSQGVDEEEIEANFFAAELLMPKRLLEKDLQAIDGLDLHDENTIEELAEKYKVSTQAFLLRLAFLGYIKE